MMDMILALIFTFFAGVQTACFVILILTSKKKGKKPADPEPEPVKQDEYQEYLEKLWQEGVNGIMSYGISNAAGKKRSDE